MSDPNLLTLDQRANLRLCADHSRMVAEAMDRASWEQTLRILGAFDPPKPKRRRKRRQ